MSALLKYKNLLALLLPLVIVFGVFPTLSVSAKEPLAEIRDLIREYYVDKVPEPVLALPTVKEITNHLDSYSVYMTAAEYDNYVNSINQQLVGIGIVLEEYEKGVKIISVIADGPAAKSGIQAGDIITAVNGKSTVGLSVQTVISLITGKENTPVTITYYRSKTNESITKILTRQLIKLPNVEYKLLGGNIAFVRLNSFSQDASREIEAAIRALKGAESWILDLRNNGGGYVSSAQDVTGLFPNITKAFQLVDKSGNRTAYPALKQDVVFTGPVHILINSYSASAAEMVAAAVKEQKGATLYGQTTYGKGTMQSLIPLSNEGLLKLTTAKFFSPSGAPINKIGVSPNIVTPNEEELISSHKAHLVRKYGSYRKLSSLQNVPITKTFTVEMNMKMDWSKLKAEDVQLIHLGGEDLPITVKPVDETTLTITPKANLESKKHYLLVIHPNWKGENGQQMKQGIYLDITVQ